MTAWGDATEIDRLVANLVSNAVKYTRDGRRVDIRLRRTDHRVVIEVADEGFGIAPEDQARLFEEFFRVPTTSSADGAGVGLAIARRVARMLGGDLRLADTPGGGATFTLLLPAGPGR